MDSKTFYCSQCGQAIPQGVAIETAIIRVEVIRPNATESKETKYFYCPACKAPNAV